MAGTSDEMGELNMDQAASIWQNVLSSAQLQQLGLCGGGSKENKENKDPAPNGRMAKRHKGDKPKQLPVQPKGSNQDLLQLMGKLILRQEDTLNSLLTEHQFLVHINIGTGSVLPDLIKVTQTWKAGNSPSKDPLRHQLALRDRVHNLNLSQDKDDVVKECWRLHILDQNMEMPYLKWNPQAQQLEPTTDKRLKVAEVLKHLEGMIRLMADSATTVRFHSMRRLMDTPTQATPWLWTVSSRNSPELWQQIKFLNFHSCWLLVQCRVKCHSMQRSALAQQLSKMI
jgi:hypothetical protein